MYIPETVRCELCDHTHTDNNGWYTILDEEGGLLILPFSGRHKLKPAVCGDNCLGKFISQKAPMLHQKEVQ